MNIDVIQQISKHIQDKSHLVIQSLNGYRIEKKDLGTQMKKVLQEMNLKNLFFDRNKVIKKNDLVLLVTLSKLVTSGTKTFETIEISDLNSQYEIIENLIFENVIITLFRI